MQLSSFKALTFDVIGTLINFEEGMLQYLRPLVRAKAPGTSDDDILEVYASRSAELFKERPEMLLSDKLREIYDAVAAWWGLPADTDHREGFRDAVEDWPPFADSVEALKYLKQHFRLVAITNSDNWAFERFNRTLSSPFHDKVTGEDVGVSKPHHGVFWYLLGRLSVSGIQKKEVLHVAQSHYHDMVPAQEVGLSTVWVYRRHHQKGWGATPPPPREVKPDLTVHSLGELADLHRKEKG